MNMQIVIDIPDEMYQKIKETFKVISGSRRSERFDYILFDAVNTGTPLPKGHGRLIDADKMKNKMLYSHDVSAEIEINGTDEFINYIFNDAPTIIEADKAESEDKE